MTLQDAVLSSLIDRLEKATSRLEQISNHPVATNNVATSAPTSGTSTGSETIASKAFSELLSTHLTPFLQLSETIGDLVKQQSAHVKKAFETVHVIIKTASESSKPADATALVKTLFEPAMLASQEAVKIKESNRSHAQFNHLSAIAEGLPALGWVFVEPTPAPYVTDMKDAAKFYTDRVLKEFKQKDKNNVDWANGWITLLTELAVFIRKNETTGLVWNPQGKTASVAPRAPAPPPAPPVLDQPQQQQQPSSDASARANLFAQLNKGENITSGLKKVEKSQMTHKNPELRASSVVPAAAAKTAHHASPVAQEGNKPEKLALEGKTWMVENYRNNSTLEITETELKQKVHIYNCEGCTVQVKGKVNAVILLRCRKTAVVVQDVVSSVEVVDSKSVQVQITGKCPTLSIDKTDGCQVFLSKNSLDVEIFTAKSTEMNISLPNGDDYVEKPLPEQYKSVIKNASIITVPVEHSAG